jgi:hypothetical protein
MSRICLIGAVLLLVSNGAAQSMGDRYLLHGDTVQVVRLKSPSLVRGASAIADSLAKALPSGSWCVTVDQDTLRCRCILNTANGRVQGTFTEYDASGRPVAVRQYTDGRENGVAAHWNSVGELLSLTTFKDGELDGVRIAFKQRQRVAGVEYWLKGAPVESVRSGRCKKNKLLARLFAADQLAPDNRLRPISRR